MATTLIVPLDMSSTAERALPLAHKLARQLSANVVLISVIDVSPDLDDFVSTKEFKEDVVRLQRDLSQYLDERATGFDDVAVETVIRMGSAVDEISLLADGFDDAALVISSHGRSGIKRHLIGSVAMRLIHQVDCPVFVLTARSAEAPAAQHVHKVLVPLDGSKLSETALDMVSAMYTSEETSLHVVRVTEVGAWRSMPFAALDYYGDDHFYQAARQAVEQYLQDTRSRLQASGWNVDIETCSGLVADEIHRAAADSGSSVIAMATHGRPGLNRLIMGSEAERVLRDSPVPVLLQRPRPVDG